MTTRTLPISPPAWGSLTQIRPGRWVNLQLHPGREQAATAVFLVHGVGGNCRQWREQWPALTAAGYRVVAWDFPGHGRSPEHRRRDNYLGAYSGPSLVEDILALLRSLGSERNILVGHSYGARLILAVLQRLQARGRLALVERAVLLGVPAVDAPLSSGLFRYLPVFLLERLRPRLEADFARLAWHPDSAAELIRQEQTTASGNALHVIKALVNQAARLQPAHLPELQLPILILAGERDGLTPLAGAQALLALLPRGALRVVPGSGHQIMLEQPAETNRHLLDFLAAGSGEVPRALAPHVGRSSG
jgi:pimeloyl-ACP methyl ester carboxylesterase